MLTRGGGVIYRSVWSAWEAVRQTAGQTAGIPKQVRRVVLPVGSGMSLSGVLWGLEQRGIRLPVLGIVVGADPTKRLNKYAPPLWQSHTTLVRPGIDYHKPAACTTIGGIVLEPIYEAKCIPFLQPDDLLWVVGIRATGHGK